MDILSLTSIQPVSVDTPGRAVVSKGKEPVDPTDKAPPGSTTGAASQKEAPRTGQKAPENLLDLLKGLTSDNKDGSVTLSLGDAKVTASLKQISLPPAPEELLQALAALGVQLPPVTSAAVSQGIPDTWIKAVQQTNLPQSVGDSVRTNKRVCRALNSVWPALPLLVGMLETMKLSLLPI